LGPFKLVSCILATKDRPGYMEQALRCFSRQTYTNRELIVVDDGTGNVSDLCTGVPGVRYLRLRKPTLLGTKLNIGIEHARGPILQKLDDDDYYHPDFLQTAISHLPARPSSRAMVAWCCFHVWFAGRRTVRFSGHGWQAGGTLCFYRDLWTHKPFRDIPQSVDSCFIHDHAPRLIRVCAPRQYLLVRHGANTWNQMSVGTADHYLSRKTKSAGLLRDFVDPADLPFYRSLAFRE
jgi:glycosyltransferase involved in cell wall biosynthesis